MTGRGVLIELGGKTRTLRFEYNSIADVEEKAGVGTEELFSERRIGLHLIRLLIWAGLRHEDGGLTPKRVGQWLDSFIRDGGDMDAIMELVLEALKQSKLVGGGDEGNPTAGAGESE